MSLVENLINQISTKGLGNITSPQGFDLEDDTFSKLLEKSMASNIQTPTSNFVGEMGIPAGLIIEPLDGTEFANTVQDQLETIGENKLVTEPISTEPFEMKDINLGDYFSSLLKSENSDNNDFMNFAKKQATNFYGLQAKNLILDTKEFVQDILSS